MTTCATNSLHRMMSQGINVVLAKSLLDIECKQNQQMIAMDSKWDDKMRIMMTVQEEKFSKQESKIQEISNELQELKEMIGMSNGISALKYDGILLLFARPRSRAMMP
jgi:hypothetical protein